MPFLGLKRVPNSASSFGVWPNPVRSDETSGRAGFSSVHDEPACVGSSPRLLPNESRRPAGGSSPVDPSTQGNYRCALCKGRRVIFRLFGAPPIRCPWCNDPAPPPAACPYQAQQPSDLMARAA